MENIIRFAQPSECVLIERPKIASPIGRQRRKISHMIQHEEFTEISIANRLVRFLNRSQMIDKTNSHVVSEFDFFAFLIETNHN